VAASKPEPANAAAEGATADAAASEAAISTHEHSPAAGAAGHTVADTQEVGTQATGPFQPQPNSPTPAAPSGAFTVTAATNGPVPLSGLAVEIAATVKSGKSSFEIRLDPADLGRIDVRIDIDRNGQITSHLTVEKPETLSMLRQDAPQLQRALDDAGLKTGSGGLQFSLRDQSSSGQNSGNDSSPNAQRLIISNEDTIPAAVAGQSYGRSLGSSSGVDIRV
jgi:flagellar hook-length control protein FliK